MNKACKCFEKAWDELVRDYKGITGRWHRDDENHRFPYGVYWKEAEVVSELASKLRKTLPEQYEVHLDVTFNPNDWEILEKHRSLIKKEKSSRWPRIDMVVLNSRAKEGMEKPFSLLAEVKYMETIKELNRSIQGMEAILRDVKRLKRYVGRGMCNKAFFCFFDERHTKGDRKEVVAEIREECGDRVKFLSIPELVLKKTKDDIVIRAE